MHRNECRRFAFPPPFIHGIRVYRKTPGPRLPVPQRSSRGLCSRSGSRPAPPPLNTTPSSSSRHSHKLNQNWRACLGISAMNQIDAARLDELAEAYTTQADYCHHMAEGPGETFDEPWVLLAA